MPTPCPDFLCHYYEYEYGPLLSLSSLSAEEGEALLAGIRQRGDVFASRRGIDYLTVRRGLESTIRELFVQKGGRPVRSTPHYFILGESSWFQVWYRQSACLRIKLSELDPLAVSFTYGDSFPAMRFQDGRPYRGKVYTLAELPGLVEQYGLPQEWNPEGKLGPERYIEAQVWQELIL